MPPLVCKMEQKVISIGSLAVSGDSATCNDMTRSMEAYMPTVNL